MGSWVKTFTSPFKKACTIFNSPTRDQKKSQTRQEDNQCGMNLECDVMACSYEDVQVMWSILDKSRSGEQRNQSS